jgi:type II secretory pathway component PulK
MNDRRGFALIAVLWVVAALGMLVSTGLANTDMGRAAAQNRSSLRRSYWASQACLSILQAQYLDDIRAELVVDSTDLGRTVWCDALSVDPALRLNPNSVDSAGLALILGDPVMTASLLDWMDSDDVERPQGAESTWYTSVGRTPPRNGPIRDVRELLLVRGFETASEASLSQFLTTRGEGTLDPNRAPLPVLRASGLVPAVKVTELSIRRQQRRFLDAENLATALDLRLAAEGFRELTRRTVFDRRRRTYEVRGYVSVGERVLITRMTVTAIALPDRLAIRRVEVE